MFIYLNPEAPKGAEIKNIYYKDELFFSAKDNDIFYPGTVREFASEELAVFFKTLFDFLEETDVTTARKYLEKAKDVLSCDKCDFKTPVRIALEGHKRKHETEKELSELGLPVVRAKRIANEDRRSTQEQIEAENAQDGLTGEGLVREEFGVGTIMS